MRNLRFFIYFAVALTCSILLLYFVHFNIAHIPTLAKNQETWGSFGAFIGGTIGTLAALLAYIGIQQQLSEQREAIKTQKEDLAFERHLKSIKDSMEQLNQLSKKSILPIESHLGICFEKCTHNKLYEAYNKSIPIEILVDVIDALRIIQSARFVYRQHLSLVNKSKEDLTVSTPLNEHCWDATATWRQFEKRVKLLLILARKIKDELLRQNTERYKEESKEMLIAIHSCEEWLSEWKSMGIGF